MTGTFRIVSLMLMTNPAKRPPITTPFTLIFPSHSPFPCCYATRNMNERLASFLLLKRGPDFSLNFLRFGIQLERLDRLIRFAL